MVHTLWPAFNLESGYYDDDEEENEKDRKRRRMARRTLLSGGDSLRTTPGALATPTLNLGLDAQLIWGLAGDGDDKWVPVCRCARLPHTHLNTRSPPQHTSTKDFHTTVITIVARSGT